MIVTVVQLAFNSVLLFSPELVHFPGPYFDTHGRPAMHRRAMERWPGSTALYEMWNDPQLKKPGRMAILLGGAATHDPALIPIYLDGIRRKSQEIRQAAAYGYHDLIGDKLPNVTVGVSDMRAGVLGQQMNRMRISLERNSLVEVWLHALLRNERKIYPGFRGSSPDREVRECLFAIERVMTIDDLESMIVAYRLTEDQLARLGLMRLIESLTLSRFVDKPTQQRSGQGPKSLETGLKRLDEAIERWRGVDCRITVDEVLKTNMATMGASISDPRSAEACWVWQNVLRMGDATWWPTAARQLYACGGPWLELSVLQAEAGWNQARRDDLLEWFGLIPKVANRSRTPQESPAPGVQ